MKYKKEKNKVVIEKDGWVWVKLSYGEIGLGDIGVDVEIIDKRS